MTLLSGSLSLRTTPKITAEEFREFRDFVYQQTGIHLSEQRQYLVESRFGSRLRDLGVGTFSDYMKLLRFGSDRQAEMSRMFELITTNETSFFRDLKQLYAVRDNVLQPLLAQMERDGRKELRIWSAGCSSGEEPYTLAILLLELLRVKVMGWSIDIVANDLSPAMVEKAKKGVYGEYSFKTTPPEMVERYFTKRAEGLEVQPKVKKLVRFSTINLNDAAAIRGLPKFHLIFCRNVIIYFDMEMKKRVLAHFYDKLLPGNCLVLGHSESIHGASRSFKPMHFPGAIIYQRED